MDYKDFLATLDVELGQLFDSQKEHIRCRPGCSACCEKGDYPMSRPDMEHIMGAFMHLPAEKHTRVKANIAAVKAGRQPIYPCPFLLDGLCCVYEHRGIVCRTHGLAYLQPDNVVKLPQCVHDGLNYSDVFDGQTVNLPNPITISLRIDDILNRYGFEPEVIKPLIEWFA